MRIENPTFALTAGGGEMAPSTPDVTRTVAGRDEPAATSPPPPPSSSGHKRGLLDGSPANQVYYVRGWKISMGRIWQALAAIFLALFLIMVVAYASRSSGGKTRPIIVTPPPTARPQVSALRECEQADCVFQAADMIQVMNLSADPCHDFYNYACGNFQDLAPNSRNSRSVYTTADWLREKNDQQVVSMLLEETDAVAPNSAVWKLKTLYTSCLNDYENMRLAGQKMVGIINEIGGLDLFGTWSEDLWNFNGTFRKVHDEHWTDAMMNFFWVQNPRIPNKNMLRITKSGTGIPYISAYLNPEQVVYRKMMTAYRSAMTTIMGMLVRDSGVNVTALNTTCGDRCLTQFTDDVIDIETKLANISVARFPRYAVFGRRRTRRQTRLHRLLGLGLRPPSRRITLDQLTQRAPQIDWMSLFDDLMGEGVVSKETMVEIPRSSYIEKLGEIISTESKRSLQHYLVWCLVRRHLMGMSVDYVFQKIRLDEVIRRARKPQSREEYCQAILDKHMGEAMGKLFAKNHIGMDTLAQAANFTRSMVEAFSTSFGLWMTGSVQYQADSILTNTTLHYGFPKWILSDLDIDMYFRPLSIIQDNFFQNMKNIDLFKRIVLRNKLRYGNNKQRWTIKATHARILSSKSGGYLALPAGMLRPPIFSPSLPHYVNTAALGSLLGQHLSLFTVTNNESRLLDRVWWDSSTNERYQPYRSCLLDLYRNHTLSPSRIYSNLPRMQLRPDRMAVSIVNRHYALDVAFAEHSRYSRQAGQPVRLPGLGHETSDQTFFLSFAQARCSTKRSASTNFLLHRLAGIIPVELEINSAVYNHHKFREVYKCSALPAEYSHASCLITPNGKRPLT